MKNVIQHFILLRNNRNEVTELKRISLLSVYVAEKKAS